MKSKASHPHSLCREDYIALAIVLLLTVIAGAVRVGALALAPPALYRDEAQNGLDALRVLAGARDLYFPANNGREPLFIYLCALSIALFGRSPDALRLVSVCAGTLIVPAAYWLGRELFDRQMGLWSAAIAVTTVWLMNLSRVAFRAGLLPLVGALALAACWRARRLRSLGWAAAGGILLGLCLYTYLAARLIPLALGVYLAWCWADRRTRRSIWWPGVGIISLTAALVSAPLWIVLARSGALLARADQVSILSGAINQGDPAGALARNVLRTIASLAHGGDFIPRHNVPWRAIYAPATAALACAGLLALAIRSRREEAARLILAWLGAMALPTILAEGAPHFLRGAGVLPAVLLLPAVGIETLLDAVGRRWGGRPAASIALAVAALAVGLSAADDLADYRAHLASDAVYYQFEAGAAQLAAQANRQLGSGWLGSGLSVPAEEGLAGSDVWISRRLWDKFPSLPFLIEAQEAAHLVEPGDPWPPVNGPVMAFLWPFEDYGALLAGRPEGWAWEVRSEAWEQGDLEPEPRLLYISLHGEPAGASEGGASFEDGLELEGLQGSAAAGPSGAWLEVALRWRAEGRPQGAYSAFVHVVCDGERVGQSDGAPGGDLLPTDIWSSGDVVVDRRRIELTRWDPQRCEIQVGLYRWQDGLRLRVLDAGGLAATEDAVVIPGSQLAGATGRE